MEKNILSQFGSRLFGLSSRAMMMLLVFLTLATATVALQATFVKFNKRFDLTPSKAFSLSPQSLKILGNLKDKIYVKAFYEKGKYYELEEKLSKFSAESNLFRFEMINLDSNPKLANDFGIRHHGQCVVTGRNRETRVKYPNESAMLSAIIRLTSDRQKRVLFLAGHGERKVDGEARDSEGLSNLKEELGKEDYQIETSLLIPQEDLAKRFDLIIIPGPQKDLLTAEIGSMTQYLKEGGSLLILLDPGAFPELEKFLNAFGIELKNDLIWDTENRLTSRDEFSPIIPFIRKNALTEGGSNVPPVFTLARSIAVSKNSVPGVRSEPFLMSSPASHSGPYKTPKGGTPYSGPIPVAALAEIGLQKEKTKSQARLVVIGDSDFTKNQDINELGNKNLILNTIGWLTNREELIGLRESSTSFNYPNLSVRNMRLLFWPSVVLMPGIAFIVGIGVSLWRRMKH